MGLELFGTDFDDESYMNDDDIDEVEEFDEPDPTDIAEPEGIKTEIDELNETSSKESDNVANTNTQNKTVLIQGEKPNVPLVQETTNTQQTPVEPPQQTYNSQLVSHPENDVNTQGNDGYAQNQQQSIFSKQGIPVSVYQQQGYGSYNTYIPPQNTSYGINNQYPNNGFVQMPNQYEQTQQQMQTQTQQQINHQVQNPMINPEQVLNEKEFAKTNLVDSSYVNDVSNSKDENKDDSISDNIDKKNVNIENSETNKENLRTDDKTDEEISVTKVIKKKIKQKAEKQLEKNKFNFSKVLNIILLVLFVSVVVMYIHSLTSDNMISLKQNANSKSNSSNSKELESLEQEASQIEEFFNKDYKTNIDIVDSDMINSETIKTSEESSKEVEKTEKNLSEIKEAEVTETAAIDNSVAAIDGISDRFNSVSDLDEYITTSINSIYSNEKLDFNEYINGAISREKILNKYIDYLKSSNELLHLLTVNKAEYLSSNNVDYNNTENQLVNSLKYVDVIYYLVKKDVPKSEILEIINH